MSPAIFIAAPTPNGLVLTDHVQSLVAMTGRLGAAGIATAYHGVDGPNLELQRDMLAARFLDSGCTHLLLLGAAIAFPPDLCERLLASGHPLVGTVPPRGPPDLARLEAALARGAAFPDAVASSFDWDVRVLDAVEPVRGGFCRVASLGTGFLLAERRCFAEIAAHVDLLHYQAYPGGMTYRGYFRTAGADRSDPDHALTRRWRAAGGEVWACVDAPVRHVAEARYGVPFTAYLSALSRAAVVRAAVVGG